MILIESAMRFVSVDFQCIQSDGKNIIIQDSSAIAGRTIRNASIPNIRDTSNGMHDFARKIMRQTNLVLDLLMNNETATNSDHGNMEILVAHMIHHFYETGIHLRVESPAIMTALQEEIIG
jgi:hypothetical protein